MKRIFLLYGVLLFSCSQLVAQIPRTISYQGVLTDSIGIFKPDGLYDIQFNLYDDAEFTVPIWSEQQSLSLSNGFISTSLGNIVGFGKNIKFDKNYFLGVKINDDVELSPKISFSSVPYSFRSIWSDTSDFAHSVLIDSVEFSYKSIYSDTANYARNSNIDSVLFSRRSVIADTALYAINSDIDSVLFSQRSVIADTAFFALNGNADSSWSRLDNNLFFEGGSVGIGTADPKEKLHVENGGIIVKNDNNYSRGLMLENISGRSVFELNGRISTENLQYNEMIFSDADNNRKWGFLHTSSNQFQIYNRDNLGTYSFPLSFDFGSPSNSFHINALGNVGIGTVANDNYKLAVNGTIISEEIIVKLSSEWPDYVFNDDYNLNSYSELERFINQNNHLPDIPSAKYVSENGASISEIQLKLLTKIEELTLYIIELNKRIKKLEDKNED